MLNLQRQFPANYRPEVDGLRGIAIIAVLLYHFDSNWLPGGYLGVDIFFALSGFLITQVLCTEFERNSKIQITNFYSRRIKRLFPALAAMMLFCMVMALVFMLPQQMNGFYKSAIAALTFTSNYYFFWFTGYFDPSALEMPLLHTWTLAVEAQFYLIFPFLLSRLLRLKSVVSISILLALALLSFFFAELRTEKFASAGFYLITTRAWELLLGAVAFLVSARSTRLTPNFFVREVIAVASIIIIFVSFFVFDKYTPMPGKYALIPCLSTIALLIFGSKTTFTKKVLSAKPLLSTGLISYGLYLWHYPLLAFARIISGNELNSSLELLLLFLIVSMALLSYFWIEKPILNYQSKTNKKVFWVWGGTTLTGIILAIFINLNAFSIFENRVGNETAHFLTPRETLTHQSQEGCFLRSRELQAENFKEHCWKILEKKKVLLIGDSLAASLAPELKKYLSSYDIGLAQLTASYCVPLIQKFSMNRTHVGNQRCEKINHFIRKKIAEHHFDVVILSASYVDYFYRNNPDISSNDFLTLFSKELIDLANAEKLMVIGQFPIWNSNLPQLIHSEMFFSHVRPPEMSNHGLDPLSLRNEAYFSSILSSTKGSFISVIDHLCSENRCRRILSDKSELISFDRSHLSSAGSNYLSTTLIGPFIKNGI